MADEAPVEGELPGPQGGEEAGGDAAPPPASGKKQGGRPKSMVWQYYTKASEANEASKRCEVFCSFCRARFLSRVETMEAHLASGCASAPADVRGQMGDRIRAKAESRAAKEAAGKAKQEAAVQQQAPGAAQASPLLLQAPPAKRVKPEPAGPSLIPWKLRFPQVHVPTHPLVNHWLAVCRNKVSPAPIFRSAVAELGRVLIYEAVQDWLPVMSGQVETPLGVADCSFVDPNKPVKVVPVLRAGLILLEQAATVLPSSETYHVGYVRDDQTLQPSMYLNKLPERFAPDDRVLVCDPMLATGGTMLALLAELVARGASQEYIRVVAVVVAPPALQAISKQYTGLRIYTGMVDEDVNEQGFIVPGLGDAGDRAFGTA